jgi:3',5'-cyclic AMP phosphodiesterase CpdA
MNTINTDLLPPLFDQVLTYYGNTTPSQYARSDIVKALENGIVNAAADSVRAARALGEEVSSKDVELKTVDRLSGANLSRTALIEQLRTTVLFDSVVLEIAVLLLEAQIDLRLKSSDSFDLSGIKFMKDRESSGEIANWCQGVLESTMRGTANDTPGFWSAFRRQPPEGLRILVEGIQFSATLRDAVPYTISVAWRLVEPLLAEPGQDKPIRLLHISDLHLVEDLREQGRSMRRPLGVATHNFNTARHLGLTVSGLNPRFDMVLATGDLTTDGSRGSFETLLQYVQSGSVSGANPMRIAAYGLNAGKSRRLLIPGNHDRFDGEFVPGQRLSLLFEEVLGTHHHYPYVVGYRPPNRTFDSLTLLFFVSDSSLPEGRESNEVEAWARALSHGYIGTEESKELIRQAELAVDEGKVRGLDGTALDFDPANTIRIAVLHHHPVVTAKADLERPNNEQPRWRRFLRDPLGEMNLVKKNIESSLMRMDGADEFLSSCFQAGIQLVLFGHQHFPYSRMIVPESGGAVTSPFGDIKSIRAFCCPTTLEHKAPSNGFYVFDFFDKAKVSMNSYVSMRIDGGDSPTFSPDASRSLNFDLNEGAALSGDDFNTAYMVKVPEASLAKTMPQ